MPATPAIVRPRLESGVPAPKGMLERIILTIVTVAGFLIGSLIYIAFYTEGYNLFQQIAVFLVALILAITIVSILWVTWAGRRGMLRTWWNP